MAVTIVGVNTASTAGAVNITIPLPAGVVSGDEVVLWLKYKRAGGTAPSVTTPSGWVKASGSSGEGVTLFQQLFTTMPPANVVVTFANSDTYCLAQSIAWRGAFDNGEGSTIRQTIFTQIAAGSGTNTLPAQYVEYRNSLMLSLYATAGASVTVPTTQTGIAASTQAGPPALGIASGYKLVVPVGAQTAETATLSASTTLVLAQCMIVPADTINPFVPFLESTPLGPYPGRGIAGHIVFDTIGDYAYYVGQDNSLATGIFTIRKIQRSTFTVVAMVTLTGHQTTAATRVAQDDTALYIAHDSSEYPNESYFKILKSDLSLVHSGAHATDTSLTHHLKLGKAGTWSAGLLFSVMWSVATGSVRYLVAWDTATGAVSSRTTIPNVTVDPGVSPDLGIQDDWDELQVDNNGDLWLYSNRRAPPGSPPKGSTMVLTKITSGVTVGTPIHLSTILSRDGCLIYDPATHALVLTSSNTANVLARPSVLARYDIATATVVYQSTYPLGLSLTAWNPWGLTLMMQYGNQVEGNNLRDFQGVPSIFIGWAVFLTAEETSWPERRRLITQFNHLTGALVRVFEMPSTPGLGETYGPVENILQSPENDLWMISVEQLPGVDYSEYIHKLNLAGAITASESAQGWVSWAEMQAPPAQTAFIRPPYGRGYGSGYGGAGPYMQAGTGNQFARPSVDTLIGTYTDAAAGVTNIYQSIDEPTLNDADYITSVSAPSNAVYVTKLTTLTDPLISTGHIVRYRYRKQDGASVQLDLVVQLRQGYVNEGTLGTLIKEWTHADISTTFVTETQTLTGGEADTITDYTSLFKRFRFNQV